MKKTVKCLGSFFFIFVSNISISQQITFKYIGKDKNNVNLVYFENNILKNEFYLDSLRTSFSFKTKTNSSIFCSDIKRRTHVFAEPNDSIFYDVDKSGLLVYFSNTKKYRKTESEFINECFINYGEINTEVAKNITLIFANEYNLSTYIDNKYIKEQSLLDDYYKSDKVSKSFYDYFKTIFWSLILNNALNNKKNEPKVFLEVEKSFKKSTNLLHISEYRDLIEIFNRCKSRKYNVKPDLLSKLEFIDNNYFYPEIKNFLLFSTMASYIKEHPDTDKIDKKAIMLFQKICKNSQYMLIINQLLKPLVLPTFVEDIVKKHPNKLLLFDFWASWCLSCIAEFPDEDKLMLKYPNIKFIFMSIDKSNFAWRKKMKEYSYMLNETNSFLLTKANNEELIKKINMLSIPRYILFGKDGKVITVDAPRPSTKKLENLILKNL